MAPAVQLSTSQGRLCSKPDEAKPCIFALGSPRHVRWATKLKAQGGLTIADRMCDGFPATRERDPRESRMKARFRTYLVCGFCVVLWSWTSLERGHRGAVEAPRAPVACRGCLLLKRKPTARTAYVDVFTRSSVQIWQPCTQKIGSDHWSLVLGSSRPLAKAVQGSDMTHPIL